MTGSVARLVGVVCVGGLRAHAAGCLRLGLRGLATLSWSARTALHGATTAPHCGPVNVCVLQAGWWTTGASVAGHRRGRAFGTANGPRPTQTWAQVTGAPMQPLFSSYSAVIFAAHRRGADGGGGWSGLLRRRDLASWVCCVHIPSACGPLYSGRRDLLPRIAVPAVWPDPELFPCEPRGSIPSNGPVAAKAPGPRR